MATATITIKDSDDGQLDIRVSFGPGGPDDNSSAHSYAVHLLKSMMKDHQGDKPPELKVTKAGS